MVKLQKVKFLIFVLFMAFFTAGALSLHFFHHFFLLILLLMSVNVYRMNLIQKFFLLKRFSSV